jgi:hypothetical protein
MYCNVSGLSPDARVTVVGYAGDTRPLEFFVDCAGLEVDKGARWGARHARVVGHCGAMVAALEASFPFLTQDQLKPPAS